MGGGEAVADHPAARRAVGRALGELIRQHLPVAIRGQVEQRLGQLAAQGDPAEWLPAFYHGLVGAAGFGHVEQDRES